MAEPENRTAEAENQEHRYAGSQIPWFVHLLWISFWLFAVSYVLIYLFPALRGELLSPP